MPWAAGVYTRGYPSWTNDANNNLPISATKFDTEDNDFASGLNNCLTIDGLNKPAATLNWAQVIALTRATDGTMFSIARTSGSHNPSLTLTLTDTGTHVTGLLNTGNAAFDFAPTAYNFGNTTDNPSFTFNGTGQVTTTGFIAQISPANTQGLITIRAGSTSYASLVMQDGQAGNRPWELMSGFAGVGIFSIYDATAAQNRFVIQTSGVCQVQDEANNLQDVGYRGIPQNVQTTDYTAVMADRGKHILLNSAGAHTLTIPANASVAYPVGTTLTFAVVGGGSATIAITSDTLIWSQTSGTGSRTLANNGVATALKYNSTSWLITGTGLS
jgi:hypothetical protein